MSNLEAERAAPALLPCPFCGRSDTAQHLPTCWFLLKTMGASEELLAKAWNDRRTPAAAAIGEDGLPSWIDDQKGKDPLMDDMITYIVDLRAQLEQHERAYRIVLDTCEGAAIALHAARDMVGHADNIAFIDRALADPEALVKQHRSQAAPQELADQAQEMDMGYRVEVPAGWRLVPVEPTEAMVHAGEDVPAPRPFGKVYRAMVAAAPTPGKKKNGGADV